MFHFTATHLNNAGFQVTGLSDTQLVVSQRFGKPVHLRATPSSRNIAVAEVLVTTPDGRWLEVFESRLSIDGEAADPLCLACQCQNAVNANSFYPAAP